MIKVEKMKDGDPYKTGGMEYRTEIGVHVRTYSRKALIELRDKINKALKE